MYLTRAVRKHVQDNLVEKNDQSKEVLLAARRKQLFKYWERNYIHFALIVILPEEMIIFHKRNWEMDLQVFEWRLIWCEYFLYHNYVLLFLIIRTTNVWHIMRGD